MAKSQGEECSQPYLLLLDFSNLAKCSFPLIDIGNRSLRMLFYKKGSWRGTHLEGSKGSLLHVVVPKIRILFQKRPSFG